MSQTVLDAKFAAQVVMHIVVALGYDAHKPKWRKAIAGQLASFDPGKRPQPWWFGIVSSVSEWMLNNADHAAFVERQAQQPAEDSGQIDLEDQMDANKGHPAAAPIEHRKPSTTVREKKAET